MPTPSVLRFPHAPGAEPNAVDVAGFVEALSVEPSQWLDGAEPHEDEMLRMLARYEQHCRAGDDQAAAWEADFRSRFPHESWRVASPPEHFPAEPLAQWKILSRSLTFDQRSQMAFALFVAPVVEATLDRFGIAALRNPRLQVNPFAGGAFDLTGHIRRLLDALDRRIGTDPYPEQVRHDRRMKRLLSRFARRCNLPRDRDRPHHPPH